MNKKYIFAAEAAAEMLGFEIDKLRDVEAALEGGCWYVTFRSDWQKYECYVDAESLELLGLNFEPCVNARCARPEYILAGFVA